MTRYDSEGNNNKNSLPHIYYSFEICSYSAQCISQKGQLSHSSSGTKDGKKQQETMIVK